MLKDRSFVLGLGVGLIAGVLMLQLMLAADVQQERTEQIEAQITSSDTLNDGAAQAEHEEQAKLLQETQAELEALKQEKERLLKEQDEKVKTALAEQLEQARQEQAEAPAVRAVNVKRGMNMSAIAELLQDAALIEDASVFLKETQLDRNRIRNGKYYFSGAPDAQQIQKILLADPQRSKPKQ